MSQPSAAAPVCYRHTDRETWIRCQRCDRPICPDCMNSASVGFQCPSCIKDGAKQTRTGTLPYGGARSSNPALTSLVLIAMNIAVWVMITASPANGGLRDKLLLLPQTTRFSDGQGGVFTIEGVSGGAVWQVLTSAFSHESALHIAFNMMALYFLGPQLEAILGRARFLALYLVSALTGSAAVMLLSDPHTQTLGASGAIFGLMGALLVVAFKVGADTQQIMVWLGINIVFTFVAASHISWQGHLGGLVGGLLISGLVVYAPKPNRALLQWSGLGLIAVVSLTLIALRAAALA